MPRSALTSVVGRFRDRTPEEYADPDLNPYMKLHRTFGPPVLTASEAAAGKGRWNQVFGRMAPLHVEVGCGNGDYFTAMATRHPDCNWLGLEIRFKRVILTARRLRVAEVTWARIARYDAFWMDDLLAEGEVACFHVNHPDPWPREKHAKNRLLARPFAEMVARMLVPGGTLRLKTDDMGHLDRLDEAMAGLPLRVLGRVDDVARQGPPWPAEDEVVTNYQRKFNLKGLPVRAMWVERLARPDPAVPAPAGG